MVHSLPRYVSKGKKKKKRKEGKKALISLVMSARLPSDCAAALAWCHLADTGGTIWLSHPIPGRASIPNHIKGLIFIFFFNFPSRSAARAARPLQSLVLTPGLAAAPPALLVDLIQRVWQPGRGAGGHMETLANPPLGQLSPHGSPREAKENKWISSATALAPSEAGSGLAKLG